MKTGNVVQKPYNGFLKNEEAGSTVIAGRRIVTKRDVQYANENGINLINNNSRAIKGVPFNESYAGKFFASCAKGFKNFFKAIF